MKLSEDNDGCSVASSEDYQLNAESNTVAIYPAPNSCVASLNKQLRKLEVRYHRTRCNLEKLTDKVSSLYKVE